MILTPPWGCGTLITSGTLIKDSSRVIILLNFQGIATLLINLMIFNYGGVLASANIMVSRLLEGEEGTYFNLKLNESEVSWIGIGSF